MFKIEYYRKFNKLDLEKEYKKIIDDEKKFKCQEEINKLDWLVKEDGDEHYTIDEILVMPLEEMVRLSCSKNFEQNCDKKKVLNIFGYSEARQGNLKYFFEDYIDINACCFCNMDYINSFEESNKEYAHYEDSNDFLFKLKQEGNEKIQRKKLELIEDIGKKTSEEIVIFLKNTDKKEELFDDLCLQVKNKKININKSEKVLKNIEELKFNYKYMENHKFSHFTLDHVLDKATHPIFSLSLYNFVPSCYPCNSKFKGSTVLVNSDSAFLSPSSKNFSFDECVTFKIYFSERVGGDIDIVLKATGKDKDHYERYIKLFKLRGRYKHHKKKLEPLLEKKNRYSQSKINEISELLGLSKAMVKEDIFGHELFDENNTDSMIKIKKDIARQLKIIN